MTESIYNLTMRDGRGVSVQWGRLYLREDGEGVLESHFLMGRPVRVVRESEPWEAEKQAMRKTLEAMTV